MTSQKTTINRRNFVKLMAILTGGAGMSFPLASCNSGTPEINNVFDLLRAIRNGVQASPDYLQARAADVVASKDPKKIFAFVRDSIQTIPNTIALDLRPNYFDNYQSTEYRWGPEGCLRYGAGTFYDKALLLEKLLNDAGQKATVNSGDFDIESVGWDKVFYYDFELPFDPVIPKGIMKTRIGNYQPKPDAITISGDPEGTVDSVLGQIMAQLPEDFVYTDPDWSILTKKMYEVELVSESGPQILNPNVRGAKVDQSYLSGKVRKASRNERIKDVKFTLKMARADDSHKPIEMFSGSVPIDVLYRNQMMLSFQHSLSTREALTTPRNKVKVLTPMLSLYGTKASEEEAAKYAFHGKSIHLHGDTLEIDGDNLLVNGEQVEAGKEHPELRNKVASIESSINASGFPDIELRFSPKDADGNIIEGMDGIDFQLAEDGAPFPFRLTENKARPLRVLLLFDLSTSVPDEFRSGAVDFGGQLVESIQEIHPDAEFLIARTYGREAKLVDEWQTDVAEVVNTLSTLKNFGDSSSELWHILNDAASTKGADFVAFFTDGQCTDQLNSKIRIGLKQACPAVLLATGDQVDQESLNQMADLTGGISKGVQNHEEVISFLSEFSRETINHPYTLKYRTSTAGKKSREAQLKLKGSSVSTTASYEVPEIADNLTGGWSGIYLTIRYNFKEITKTIAGKKLFSYEKNHPVTNEHLKDTEAALFGHYRINFEGAEPTLSMLLDEWIDARLSQESLYNALGIGESATLDAIDAGYVTCPDEFLFMQAPFAKTSGADFITFQNGVRATIFSERPRGEDGKIMRHVDILPFSQWRTIHQDTKKAFEKTVKHSLTLMQLEASNFPISTMSTINGANLDMLDKKAIDEWIRELWKAEDKSDWMKWNRLFHGLERWTYDAVLVSKQRDASAYYTLHHNSGTVMAMLDSGGAGAAETRAHFDRVAKALTAFALVMSALGMGGFIGVWAALEKAKMRHLQMATIAILTMDGPSEEEINDSIADSACDAAGVLAGALGVPFVEAISMINDVLSLGDHPLISGCSVGG
ncbi:MAG: hypothetical protein AAF502_11230 [Bacteroidota bacterium]